MGAHERGLDDRRVTNRALVVIAILLVLAGLKWSTPATMPLAFAIFLIALCWPIREFLNRHVSSALSFVGTTLALLIVLALFVGAIYFAVQSVASGLPKYNQDLQNLLDHVRSWLQGHGLPAPREMIQEETLGRLARNVVTGLYTWSGLVLFVLALAILGLPAVPQMRRSIERMWDHGETGREVLDTSRRAAQKVQRYLAAATLTSGITGVLSGLLALVVGLDFAFLWGLIAFVLNYIPTVGSVIAVIPPTLFAFLQFDGILMPLVVFLGLSIIQIVMGSFVYPTVAGRHLQVMPVVLLFSLGFWAFIWGIPGALLATPLTVTILIVLREFGSAHWVPELLAAEPSGERDSRAIIERIKAALSLSS
jgi:predicted PurR-regulated permease PerM